MRSTVVLCALTLLLGAWTCWTVAPAGMLPAFWLASPLMSPHFVAGFSIALALFGAPFIFTEEVLSREALPLHLSKAALAALWLAVASAFMMLAASRVSPVSGSGIAQAGVWIFFTAWFSIVLNRLAPRGANALLFLWAIALPILAYMLAEIYLMSPAGAAGLAEATAPQAAVLRSAIHWLLNLSPGTATIGALNGTLVDGSDYSFAIASITMLAVAIPLVVRRR